MTVSQSRDVIVLEKKHMFSQSFHFWVSTHSSSLDRRRRDSVAHVTLRLPMSVEEMCQFCLVSECIAVFIFVLGNPSSAHGRTVDQAT